MRGVAVGLPNSPSAGTELVVRADPPTTELVPRANLRISGAKTGVAVATVSGSFVLATAICSSGIGVTCIIGALVSLLQGWAFIYLADGTKTDTTTTTVRLRGLPAPEWEFTVQVGGGVRQLDDALHALVHPDHFGQASVQDLLEEMRYKDAHYLTLSRDASGRSTSMWFINETSHPGLDELQKRDTANTRLTKAVYTWDREGPVRFQEFDKRSASINAIATRVGEFCGNHFHNKFCLGFDDDDADHPLVNNGELYFNQGGDVQAVCNQNNQGVFRI